MDKTVSDTPDLTVRLDQFRHHEDEQVAAITTEAANEICRLCARVEELERAVKAIVASYQEEGRDMEADDLVRLARLAR